MATETNMSPKICLLVIKSSDIDKARVFYEMLGFTFTDHKHSQTIHYASDDFGFPFEIYPVANSVKNHVCIGFTVEDIEGFRTHLVGQGLDCSIISQSPFGTLFVTRDPDENRVEIYGE